MSDELNRDFHFVVSRLIDAHWGIEPWFDDEQETLDTKRIKFFRCPGGKPIVHDTAPKTGGLWVREEDFHEDYAFENHLNINSMGEDRSQMMPNIHILNLPAMQSSGLMCYDGRDIWAAVKLLQDLAGQPETKPW